MTVLSKFFPGFAAIVAAGLVAVGGATLAMAAPPFPDAVAGWAKGEERSFTAQNLYEYIDGDAEKYVKAGVKGASTADYSFQGKIDAVADVYTMSDANGAKTIFESEAAGDAKPAAVGDAARAYSQSLVFRKGPYLVRIVAYQNGPELAKALVDLGHGVEQQLGK